jgi:4-amino-4-deoxy-L-arabinose transferase-like glycosyltransferase
MRSALGIAHGAVWPTIPALLPSEPHSLAKPPGNSSRRRLVVVLGICCLLRLLAIAWWPLTGDEAYHWEWADNPSLGYFDHPPLHAWSMTLSTAIFGHSAWAVRVPNALAGLAMALLLVA